MKKISNYLKTFLLSILIIPYIVNADLAVSPEDRILLSIPIFVKIGIIIAIVLAIIAIIALIKVKQKKKK